MTRMATVRVADLGVRCTYSDQGVAADICQRAAEYAVRKDEGEGDWAWRCMRHAGWWALNVPIGEQTRAVEFPADSPRIVNLPRSAVRVIRDDADHVYDDADDEAAHPRPPIQTGAGHGDGDVAVQPYELTPEAQDNEAEIMLNRAAARGCAHDAERALAGLQAALDALGGDGRYDVEVAEGMRHAPFHLQAARAHVDALKRDIEEHLT